MPSVASVPLCFKGVAFASGFGCSPSCSVALDFGVGFAFFLPLVFSVSPCLRGVLLLLRSPDEKRLQPLLIGWRAVDNPALYFHPRVSKERRGAITDHQARIHTMLAQQPGSRDRSLQTQHRFPVETGRQQDRFADRLF